MLQKGEGPVWSGADNLLYFVDIDGKSIHSYDPATGAHEKLAMPAMVASVRPDPSLCRGSSSQTASEYALHPIHVDPKSSAHTVLANPVFVLPIPHQSQ